MHSALCKNVPFVTKFLCASYCNNYFGLIFVPSDQILGSSSSVSESSSAEKSIAGLLSNADEQLRRAREYNNRMAQKMYTHTRHNLHTHTRHNLHTHTPDTIYTHSQTSTHTEKACQHNSHNN